MNSSLAAVFAMGLKELDSGILAAANLGISGFGKLAQANIAFESMRDLSFVREDGTPHNKQELLAALSHVINERVDAGKFN